MLTSWGALSFLHSTKLRSAPQADREGKIKHELIILRCEKTKWRNRKRKNRNKLSPSNAARLSSRCCRALGVALASCYLPQQLSDDGLNHLLSWSLGLKQQPVDTGRNGQEAKK